MKRDMTMRITRSSLAIRTLGAAAAAAFAMACSGTPAPPGAAQVQAAATFASPEQAVAAVLQAASSGAQAVLAILGPDGKDLVTTGDSVQDQKDLADFVRLAREKATIVRDPSDPHRATIAIGNDDFPFAIPLTEANGQWMLNATEGRYEVLLRRIGSNELDTIAVFRGYVDAQQQYAAMDPDQTGEHQYAQHVIGTPGKRDGLYWKSEAGGPESPIGEPIARALAEGYSDKSQPYHGYYYKVLTAQGKSAPLGEMDFVVRGRMIGGFALVAWPAQYRVTGVQTFIVSHDGIVFQQDLGPDTAKVAAAMTTFDPDKTWTETNDEVN